MDEKTANSLLDQLASGEVQELLIKREDFLFLQPFLVKRADFKQFRGIAMHGGGITYTYMDEPRS